jgi:hypothetical protein
VAEIVGQVGAQRHRVAVRVAVEVAQLGLERLADRLGHLVGQRIRVLVGVQPDGDIELRRTVGRLPTQIVPDRQIVEVHWNLTFTASPWAGRSSALASATT